MTDTTLDGFHSQVPSPTKCQLGTSVLLASWCGQVGREMIGNALRVPLKPLVRSTPRAFRCAPNIVDCRPRKRRSGRRPKRRGRDDHGWRPWVSWGLRCHFRTPREACM
jgi:hypothetical protein